MQVLLLQEDYGVTIIMFIICTIRSAMEMKAIYLSVLMANKTLFPAAVTRDQYYPIIGTTIIQITMLHLWSVSQVYKFLLYKDLTIALLVTVITDPIS